MVRENTEGEYSNSGGILFEGTQREIVIQESVYTRIGAERVLKFAYELAQKRGKHLTEATKSNGISISMTWWDDRVAGIGKQYTDVRWDKFHIDFLCEPFRKEESGGGKEW